MNLQQLQAYLISITVDGVLILDAQDSNLPDEFQAFLLTIPNQKLVLTLDPATGIELQTTLLIINGSSADLWSIYGMNLAGVQLATAVLTIDTTHPTAVFSLVGHGALPLTTTVHASVTVTSPQTSDNPAWMTRLDTDVDAISVLDLLMAGVFGELPYPLPTTTDIFNLTTNLAASDFDLQFYPNTRYSYRYLYTMRFPNANWIIIPNLLTINQIDINVLQMLTTIGCGITGHFVIGSVPVNLGFALNPGPIWQGSITPGVGTHFPGLVDLTNLILGGDGSAVTAGFNSLGFDLQAFDLAITKLTFDINWVNPSLVGMSIQSILVINNLAFDVLVQLPEYLFIGRLHNNTPIQVADFLTMFGLDATAVPSNLVISEANLTLRFTNLYYNFAITVDNIWSLGVVALTEVKLTVSYFESQGFEGEFVALLNIAGTDIELSSAYIDEGWQFLGQTMPEQVMPIGELISYLAATFGVAVPAMVHSIELKNLLVGYNTKSTQFIFTCEGTFTVDTTPIDIVVNLQIQSSDPTNPAAGYTIHAGGTLTIGSLIFALQFASDPNSNLFIATYSHTSDQASISVKDLIGAVSTDVAAYIPESLMIDLKDVLFAYQQDTQTRFAFGFDLAASLNLSDLPLVGKAFPSNQTLAVQDLQVLIASLDFPATVVTQLNTVLATQHILALPSPLVEGITVSALIDFGTSTQALSMPLAGDSSTVTPPTPPTSTTSVVTSNASAKWFDVKKGFGPVYFERIGVQYQDSALWFLLDASLTAAGLTLTVEGLGFGSPLNVFSPSFRIQGLGLDYRNAVVEIGGAFVHTTVSNQGQTYDEYDGMATLRVKQFNLGAIGSYAYLDDHPSLFVYAVLDFPLGGPAFFFVTGLSAGFGYNRSLIVPPIEQIARFPLVAEAISGPPSTVNSDPQQTIQTELALLRQYIPPSIGEMFLTAGIRFNSFRLIDSFALLTVSFGQHFEVDLLGLSTAIIPTPDLASTISPLAEIQMALVASFIPDQGFLGVRAQLTSASYLLSRSCHLTGGFAFYAWFAKEHAGDFVLTLGGYHPSFTIPSHYPQVPRLGFNWQIDSSLILKGGMYFALTGSLLMAGGTLQATWQSGNLKAWFNAAADFLLGWKPYHYDARLSVDIGVSYTFHLFGTHHITADVGADLHIWGPDFSGTARIDLDIISFDISFGAAAAKTPQPIDWASFSSSFLPDPTAVCGVAVGAGLVQTPQGDPTCDWVINPASFLLTTNSLIPTTSASFGQASVSLGSNYDLNVGVAPMAVAPSSLTSHQIIQITHNGASFEHDFALTPIAKGMPNALWGTEFQPNLQSAPILPNAIAGFEIRPQQPPAPGSTSAINQSYLEYNTQTVADGFAWQTDRPFVAESADDAQRRTTISTTLNAPEPSATRESLLAAFGLDCPLNLQASLAQSYVVAPQVGIYADEQL